jgi:hypothetical protein
MTGFATEDGTARGTLRGQQLLRGEQAKLVKGFNRPRSAPRTDFGQTSSRLQPPMRASTSTKEAGSVLRLRRYGKNQEPTQDQSFFTAST